jgi:dephospho-CoA kinase
MGKSTVSEMFRELGAVCIDTDKIVRDLLHEPSVVDEIKKTFGDDIMEGNTVNRKMLADIVFQNPHLRIALEDILHPLVFKRIIEERISQIAGKGDPCIVIIEAPVIFERSYQNRFDKIITVFTSEDTALNRLKEKGISSEEAVKRLKSQFPVETKVKKSDFAIDNSRDLKHTRKQVEDIYQQLLMMEKRHGYN